jgi:ABC-type sugar transport system substrate-binding protein
MQTAIAGKADGIAVPLIDATAFDSPTANALAAGIPVIGYNADVPAGGPNKRLCYVGQSLYQSGYNIATRWLNLVPKGGHVMLSIISPGTLNVQPRLDGYIQAIKGHGNTVTYDVVNTSTDQATELSRIGSYYLSHKDGAHVHWDGNPAGHKRLRQHHARRADRADQRHHHGKIPRAFANHDGRHIFPAAGRCSINSTIANPSWRRCRSPSTRSSARTFSVLTTPSGLGMA